MFGSYAITHDAIATIMITCSVVIMIPRAIFDDSIT